MTSRTAATRYARALLDVSVAENLDLRHVESDLAAFAELLTAHPALGKVLTNPAVPVGRKRATVAELTSRANALPIIAKLLALLADRDRLVLLPDLVAAYRERLLDHLKIVRVEVTTVAPLEPERTRALETSLARTTGLSVMLATKVDPSIVGGVIARVGSVVYDSSITTHLAKMKRKLIDSV